MSSGAGGRRFPTDSDFGDSFKNTPQYGRGYTRYILIKLEEAFGHKERVDLDSATIEHIMPQSITKEWELEIGPSADAIHARLKDTFGNLSLTGYNTELGNLPFREKKQKLSNTHIELNRFLLQEDMWGENEIMKRSDMMLQAALKLWPGPVFPTTPTPPPAPRPAI